MVGTYAPLDYDMDPEFDDLIRGDELQDGMIVLIEEMREDPSRLLHDEEHPYVLKRIRETARWCTVTKLRFVPYPDAGQLVEFIGVYADGTKASRRYNESWFWFVKKDSIPSTDEERTDLVVPEGED